MDVLKQRGRKSQRQGLGIVLVGVMLLASCGNDVSPLASGDESTTQPSATADSATDSDVTTSTTDADEASENDESSDTTISGTASRGEFPDVIYDLADVDEKKLDDGTAVIDDDCRDIDDAQVTHQPDVLSPPEEIAAVSAPDQKIGSQTVPGVDIDADVVPGSVVDGGCVIEYDAPGGCLGKVEITPVRMPGAEIPGVDIPEGEVGGTTIEALTLDPVSASEIVEAGASADQVCQLEVETGERTPSVRRPSIRRPSLRRPSLRRDAGRRPSVRIDGETVKSVNVKSVTIDSINIDSVTVESGNLKSKPPIDDNVTRVGDDARDVFLLEADVLFDFDKAELRPEAEKSLKAVAAELPDDGDITVDGHADSKGDEAYNQELSERRAEVVKKWLVDNADVDASRITANGFGQTVPVAPNENEDGSDNPEGRQQNRRVVINAQQ